MPFPDYPFQSNYFDRGDQIRMHYVDEGPRDAPPVIMVHGNPTWSFYYRRVISALSKTHRCIAMDHVGMGLSDKPKCSKEPGQSSYDYTLKQRIDDLGNLIEHLGISSSITLIVHDWGGMIGTGLATRLVNKTPASIKQFVILNTAAFHLPTTTNIPWQLKVGRSFIGPLLIKGFNTFCKGSAKQCVTRRPLPADVRDAYLSPYNSWANRVAVNRFVQDIPLSPAERAWPVVDQVQNALPAFKGIPMLICWGMNDFVFNPHYLAEWEKHFPNAQVHKFDDAGHYILEDAHEDVIPLIQEFIK
jgi:cis-3-alkyl-4-acyloxetan-2-one decarboxylase